MNAGAWPGIVTHAANEVYNELGSGHTETVYESAMEVELGIKDLGPVRRQVPCPIYYKGYVVGTGFIDMLIDNILVVEMKAVNRLSNKEQQQVRKYMTSTGLDHGLLINFGNELEVEEVFLTKELNGEERLTEAGVAQYEGQVPKPESRSI